MYLWVGQKQEANWKQDMATGFGEDVCLIWKESKSPFPTHCLQSCSLLISHGNQATLWNSVALG